MDTLALWEVLARGANAERTRFQGTLLGGIGHPRYVGGVIAFLLDPDRFAFITDQKLAVGGGALVPLRTE